MKERTGVPNCRSSPATRKKRAPRVTIEAAMKTPRLNFASPLAIVTSL